VYPRFIRAVAEIPTSRFRFHSLLLLGSVVVAAMTAILLLAGPIKDLVVTKRSIMYSIFIGLTLGGVPVVWALLKPPTRGTRYGAAGGFVAMAMLALAQQSGTSAAGSSDTNFVMLFVAGIAGASAMILPGVSGGYLLLVLGQYIPILAGIDAIKEALSARDIGAMMDPALGVALPVGIGVVAGVVGVSNLLKWLLARYEKVTLGVLLGLLLGAVVGLWPFQRPIEPVMGETIIKGQVITEADRHEFEIEDFPTERFDPAAGQIAGALGLILAGAAATLLISRFGGEGRDED
jgi:putative membrane protein